MSSLNNPTECVEKCSDSSTTRIAVRNITELSPRSSIVSCSVTHYHSNCLLQVCNAYFPNSIRTAASFSSSSSSSVSRSPDGKLTILQPRGVSRQAPQYRKKSSSRSRRMLSNLTSTESTIADSSRSLRLRNYQDTKSFKFIPELVTSTGRERIREYRAALDRLPTELKSALSDVDKRLRRFGYSLTEWAVAEAKSNLLTPWELVA